MPYVKVTNQGWFVAQFAVTYLGSGGLPQTEFSGNIPLGFSKSLFVPSGALVAIEAWEWWGFGWKTIFGLQYLGVPRPGVCFLVWGTTLSPEYSSVRCADGP